MPETVKRMTPGLIREGGADKVEALLLLILGQFAIEGVDEEEPLQRPLIQLTAAFHVGLGLKNPRLGVEEFLEPPLSDERIGVALKHRPGIALRRLRGLLPEGERLVLASIDAIALGERRDHGFVLRIFFDEVLEDLRGL